GLPHTRAARAAPAAAMRSVVVIAPTLRLMSPAAVGQYGLRLPAYVPSLIRHGQTPPENARPCGAFSLTVAHTRLWSRPMTSKNFDRIGEMSADEKDRILRTLQTIGDTNTVWAPAQFFDVWLVEHRMGSERAATARLVFATWALVGTTAVLVL